MRLVAPTEKSQGHYEGSGEMPDVRDVCFDIVIPTYGRSDFLAHTLAALSEQAIPATLECVHVVENGPYLGAEQVCHSFSGKLPLSYHYLDEPGVNGARNLGAKASQAEIVLFFDDDVKPLPGALACYAEAFSRLGPRFFFGGPLLPEYEERPPGWLFELLPKSARGFSLGELETEIEGPAFIGSNFAVPKTMLDDLGYFEGPCPTGATGGGLGDETRLQRRMMMGGYAGIYLPGAGVLHWVPKNRCDADFLRHRAWRTGYGEGQLAAIDENGSRRILLGAPGWIWRDLGASIAHLFLAIRPGLMKVQVFERLLTTYRCAGAIRGFKEARRGSA